MPKKPQTEADRISQLEDEVAKTSRELAFVKTRVGSLVKEIAAELQPDTRALVNERLQAIFEQALGLE